MTAPDTGLVDDASVERVVDAEHVGIRLDAYLAASIATLSRSRGQRAIDDGDVTVNGAASKASYKLREGDRIEIELPAPPTTDVLAEAIPLSIVFEDDDLVVIDKPAGMVVHPGAGVQSGTLANALVHRFGGAAPGPNARPGIVHRLDKDTSGLIVVARTEDALSALSTQFQERTVTKSYIALVYGRPKEASGRFNQPIARHPRIRTRMAVVDQGEGRPALTLYRVREWFDEVTLLDVDIRTGRTHQIRVHLAAANHPVVADDVYGAGQISNVRDARLRKLIGALGRQFLHASTLEFDHPRTGKRMSFSCPLPDPLPATLEYCREHAR